MSELLEQLQQWLQEDPEISWAEVQVGEAKAWRVRLMQTCEPDEHNPNSTRCVADGESATFNGALAGALMLVREFKEGHS